MREEKTSRFEEVLIYKIQSNVTGDIQNPRDSLAEILSWNDYGAVKPSTFIPQNEEARLSPCLAVYVAL